MLNKSYQYHKNQFELIGNIVENNEKIQQLESLITEFNKHNFPSVVRDWQKQIEFLKKNKREFKLQFLINKIKYLFVL